MAWNQPNIDRTATDKRRRSGSQSSLLRGAVAGAIVVLGVAVVAWWLLLPDRNGKNSPEPKKSTPIREAKPKRPAQKATHSPKPEKAEEAPVEKP